MGVWAGVCTYFAVSCLRSSHVMVNCASTGCCFSFCCACPCNGGVWVCSVKPIPSISIVHPLWSKVKCTTIVFGLWNYVVLEGLGGVHGARGC